MNYLWQVWTIGQAERSALDETVMIAEAVVLLLVIALVKVYIIDEWRGK